MPSDLLDARRLGYILRRQFNLPEGAALDPPFLRYDPELPHEQRAAIVQRLLAQAQRS